MQVVPYTSVPAPIPDGLMQAIEAALGVAGFPALASRAPEGLLVTDKATALAAIASYTGSAFQLTWARSNAGGTGLLDQLAALYAQKFAAGRIYSDGKTYQIDPASQANISSMGSVAATVVNSTTGHMTWPAGFGWIAADNTKSLMTAAQMYALTQNVATYVSALVLNNFTLKTAINAAATVAAVQAININAGWPSNP